MEKNVPIDAVTAIFNFLSTDEGQKLIDPLVKLNTEFITLIFGLIKHIHDKGQATSGNSTPSPKTN